MFISYDGNELNFTDIRQIGKEGDQEPRALDLHLPYRYSFIKRHHYRLKALSVKDRYSVGIIILEILVGTEPVLAARHEELVEQLLDDCSPYLDRATELLLRHLILHEGNSNIDAFMK